LAGSQKNHRSEARHCATVWGSRMPSRFVPGWAIVAASLATGLCAAAIPSAASAQVTAISLRWPTGESNPPRALIGLNLDDDDDDGVPDGLASVVSSVARDDDQAAVSIDLDARGPLRVEVRGGVRVVDSSGALVERAEFGPAQRHTVRLVGTAVSERADDTRVVFLSGSVATAVTLTVAAVTVLDGQNEIRWPHRDAASLARSITNDETLPRSLQWSSRSGDRDDVRVELFDVGAPIAPSARLESIVVHSAGMVAAGSRRSVLATLPLIRDGERGPLRSRFVRLVGDSMDLNAPGVQGQTLLVALRDRLRASYRRPGVAGEASFDLRVGRPGNEDGPLAARRARWRLVTLRATPGGRPVIGNDDDGAAALLREQVQISNEIYLQCAITFGVPASYPVLIADPPRNTLLSVSDDDGLRAGGGDVAFRVGARSIGPVAVRRGSTPLETAEAIGRAIQRAGLNARVTANRRTDYAALGSADVMVSDGQGRWLAFEQLTNTPLSTDRRQRIQLGTVDLRDGVEEFQNMNSASGTLEERTLLKALVDDDPTTIDLLIINRFTRGTRIGEAFVEGDGGAIVNALFVDRTGLSAQREAWTQSHEVGHIVLDQPWHPDNLGPDRPWLLMDADASLAAVNGPKRLTSEECARVREESGPTATPSLLQRFDEARPSARAQEFRRWPTRPVYPRPPAAPSVAASARPAAVRARAAEFELSIE
jgi:hypothetical protein